MAKAPEIKGTEDLPQDKPPQKVGGESEQPSASMDTTAQPKASTPPKPQAPNIYDVVNAIANSEIAKFWTPREDQRAAGSTTIKQPSPLQPPTDRFSSANPGLPKRALNRYSVFRWLAKHPKFSGWGGLALAISFTFASLSLEIDGAIKTAAVGFFLSWATFSFAAYISNWWETHRKLAITAIAFVGMSLPILLWAYLPGTQSVPPTAKEIADELDRRKTETNVTGGFLQFDRIEISSQYSYLIAGKQFGGNFYSRNPGPSRVFNAFGYSKAFVAKVEEATDQIIQNLFDQELAPIRESYFAGKIKGPEQGIGQGIWMTVLTPVLTQEEVEGISKGSTKIYFVTWLAWADRQGSKDSAYDCRWLQGHTLPAPYKKEDIVWHFCQ